MKFSEEGKQVGRRKFPPGRNCCTHQRPIQRFCLSIVRFWRRQVSLFWYFPLPNWMKLNPSAQRATWLHQSNTIPRSDVSNWWGHFFCPAGSGSDVIDSSFIWRLFLFGFLHLSTHFGSKESHNSGQPKDWWYDVHQVWRLRIAYLAQPQQKCWDNLLRMFGDSGTDLIDWTCWSGLFGKDGHIHGIITMFHFPTTGCRRTACRGFRRPPVRDVSFRPNAPTE